MKFNPFRFKHSRIVYGILFLIVGAILAIFPLIPFGYAFLFAAFFLLAHKVPVFNKAIRYFRERDKKGRIKKVEGKIKRFFGN